MRNVGRIQAEYLQMGRKGPAGAQRNHEWLTSKPGYDAACGHVRLLGSRIVLLRYSTPGTWRRCIGV